LSTIFIGIDVACARGKPLPICFAQRENGRLVPLSVPEEFLRLIPRGPGNVAITELEPFAELASTVVSAVQRICEFMRWEVGCVAIDAPSAAPIDNRRCEAELSAAGLSVFKTPSVAEWTAAIEKCRQHLREGGPLSRLPYANKIWMRYGFQLFAAFRKVRIDTIEVYPFAIVRAFLPKHPHKSTAEGYSLQLDAVAQYTGWTAGELDARLRLSTAGCRHDRLDAFMAALIASLGADARRPFGDPTNKDDVIWVPEL
jgi:predicted nuclease with RNAse H fold